MEHSSPLAAMQPPSVLFGHCFGPGPSGDQARGTGAADSPSFAAAGRGKGAGVGGPGSGAAAGPGAAAPPLRCAGLFGPHSLRFQDPSACKGSSPTVSLAADLAQNFHIDKSPPAATPRRSLFTTARRKTSHERYTPSLPPSSPAFETMELMDISPLPHKMPWPPCLDSSDPNPSSGATPRRSLLASSHLQDSPLDTNTSRSSGVSRRKKASFARPSCMRKAQALLARPTPLRPTSPDLPQSSASDVDVGISSDVGAGNGNDSGSGSGSGHGNEEGDRTTGNDLKTPGSPSLSEMFEGSSPVRQRANVATPGSPIKFTSGGFPTHRDGSPVPRRRSSNPFARPRKQSRRAISMFESNEDIAMARSGDDMSYVVAASCTASTGGAASDDIDMDTNPTYRLPHFIPRDQDDRLPRIDQRTMAEILEGKYEEQYKSIRIIDCRFPFEYEGGHINGAVNHNAESLVTELFADGPEENTALVLHCEFSKYRAPEMAQCIRSRDRAFNIHEYPKLSYPEMYILEGGYSAFFSEYKNHCYPQSYIRMGDKAHEFACERGLGKIKKRSKLARASTFTFGQDDRMTMPKLSFSNPRIDESPTRPFCSSSRLDGFSDDQGSSPLPRGRNSSF
ncbi:cell division cycle 25 [Ascosphaera acerosa]|nr:cell division cycle 25 [Ascosphaera acerosa]